MSNQTAQFNGEVGNIESNVNKVDTFSEDISDEAAKQKYPSVQCIKNLPRVIESGESGIWSYRKWSDGIIEMFACKNSPQNIPNNAGGGTLGLSDDNVLNYPFALKTVIGGSVSQSDSICWIGKTVFSTTDVTFNILRTTPFQSNVNFQISVSVIGRWK